MCGDCSRLLHQVRLNMGKMGLGQLMDELIATGIPKPKIKKFLEVDAFGKGSVMSQLLAGLTNNLAAGIGVKNSDMTAKDVDRIRKNPTSGVSTQRIEE